MIVGSKFTEGYLFIHSDFDTISPKILLRLEEDFDTLNSIQIDILNNMSKYVKPKGTIVYATCSLEEEENWK